MGWYLIPGLVISFNALRGPLVNAPAAAPPERRIIERQCLASFEELRKTPSRTSFSSRKSDAAIPAQRVFVVGLVQDWNSTTHAARRQRNNLQSWGPKRSKGFLGDASFH